MNNKSIALMLTIVALIIAGCGSATGPLVDLPAPIVGRIGAGGPADTGKATIIGTAGAVPQEVIDAGGIVVAENTRITGSTGETALLWNITDALVPAAFAQTLPTLCEQQGFACAFPLSDGSFTISIDSWVNDSIKVYFADAQGNPSINFIEVVIPTSSSIADCGGSLATGLIVDVKVAGGLPIALFEGLDDSESPSPASLPNRLTIGMDEFELPGCYAKELAIYPVSATEFYVAAISTSEQLLWVGRWDGSNLVLGKTITLSDLPEGVMFAGDPTYVHLAIRTAAGFTVEKFEWATETVAGSLAFPDVGLTLTEMVALRSIGPFADSGYLGAIVARGISGPDFFHYIMYFQTESMVNATLNGYQSVESELLIAVADIADMQFGSDPSIGDIITLLIDSNNNAFYTPRTYQGVATQILLPVTNASDLTDTVYLDFSAGIDEIQAIPALTPTNFAVGVTSGIPIAYVLSEENLLWTIPGYMSVTSVSDTQTPLSGATSVIAIALEDAVQALWVADDDRNAVLDFSSLWGAGL